MKHETDGNQAATQSSGVNRGSAAQNSSSQTCDPSSSSAEERVNGSDGYWPLDCLQRAFVAGAKWWQFHANGATAFASEVDEMEAQAIERYGDPMTDSRVPTGGEPEQETDHGAALLPADPSAAVKTEPLPRFKYGDRVEWRGRIGTYEGEHPIHDCPLVRFDGDYGQSMTNGAELDPIGSGTQSLSDSEPVVIGERCCVCGYEQEHVLHYSSHQHFHQFVSGTQPLSETSGSNAQERERKDQKPLVVPSLPSADIQRLVNRLLDIRDWHQRMHDRFGAAQPAQKEAMESLDQAIKLLLCQSEAQQEKEQKEYVGGHVSPVGDKIAGRD